MCLVSSIDFAVFYGQSGMQRRQSRGKCRGDKMQRRQSLLPHLNRHLTLQEEEEAHSDAADCQFSCSSAERLCWGFGDLFKPLFHLKTNALCSIFSLSYFYVSVCTCTNLEENPIFAENLIG
ncbi:hypothetical protein ILYODFUR_020785 [Ilyodon furcidens]|uniref:Uncharacterized protein n=1 Tax=Ilyodon furcidens TaxID=33524 RepID=A0ABV0ULX2_9TELE